jgi:hypothetical protein
VLVTYVHREGMGMGLIGVSNIEDVGLIHVIHIERVGLIDIYVFTSSKRTRGRRVEVGLIHIIGGFNTRNTHREDGFNR